MDIKLKKEDRKIPIDTITSVAFGKNILPYYYIRPFDTSKANHIQAPHIHDYYAVFLFEQGHGINDIDFKEYPIHPFRLFFMYPGQVHDWHFTIPLKGYLIVFGEECLQRKNINPDKFIYIPYIDIPQEDQPFFEKLFLHLLKESNNIKEYTNNHVMLSLDYLFSLLDHLFRQQHGDDTLHPNTKLFTFKQLIEQTITQNIPIQRYATNLNISVYELNNMCKKTFQVSAKQYILNQKLIEAKRLLIYSELTVAEIAYHLGFEDNSYFTRFFKQKTGYTPTRFVEEHRGK